VEEYSAPWTPAPKKQTRPALRPAKASALACAAAFLIVGLLSRAPRKAPASTAPAARVVRQAAPLPAPAPELPARTTEARTPAAAASGLDLVRADLAESAAAPSVAFADADGLQAPSDSLTQGPAPSAGPGESVPAARAVNPRLGGGGSSAFAHWAWRTQASAPACPSCAGSTGAVPGDLGLKRTPVIGARITFESRCRDGYTYKVTNVTGMPIMQMDDSEVNGGEVWNLFLGPYGTGTITSKLPPENMTSVIYLGTK
jgi:hypothetical protein